MGKSHSKQRTLLVGTGSLVRELLEEFGSNPRCRYEVEGIVVEPAFNGRQYHGHDVLGSVETLGQVINELQPDVIIVAHTSGSVELFEHHLLEASLSRQIRIEQAAAVYERLTGKLPLEAYEMDDVIYSDTFRPGRWSLAATRLLSLLVALVGLVALAPLMLLIAVLIKLDSPGPALFVQERAGFRGKRFMLAKFRTMAVADGPRSEWEEDNAHRITRVGRWLRKFRLDELPQFFNVIRGDMNLVGPRPHPTSNLALLALVARNTPESGVPIPYYALRCSVRPGITGWAQVRYRYANNLQEEIEKLHFDLYYLKHYSLGLDLRILFETVWVVVTGYVVKADSGNKPAEVKAPEIEAPEVRRDVAASEGQTSAS
jgi:exopolysaccharide biosynthesis polyprenyl glycosylphosphotransferase